MEKTYDMIVSLGGNCYVAAQLRHRGMRPYSLPLDWTYIKGPEYVAKLPELIRTKFADFCIYENMKDIGEPEMEVGKPTYKFEDTLTGFGFVHQFHAPLTDKEGFAVDRAIIQKRIDRMYKNVSQSKRVLFVLETSFTFDEAIIRSIYEALRDTFANTEVDLRVMQFGGKSLVDADIGPHIHFTRHIRPSSLESEVYGTAAEWNWLDELRLANRPKAAELRKRNLIVKWKYSLWKALGKSLQKDGAGCVNLVLP